MMDADLLGSIKRDIISPYLTTTLVSETMFFITESPAKWVPQAIENAKFFLTVPWTRMFREPAGPMGIYVNELEGKLPREYLFYDRQYTASIINGIRGEIDGSNPLDDEERRLIREEKETWKQKKIQNHKHYKLMRDDIKRKAAVFKEDRKNLDFKNFRDMLFEKEAIKKIEGSINSSIPKDKLVAFWKANRHHYPHFNTFIEGQLFMAWHSMATDQKIDVNGYEDIEHLIYLNDVDAIVGNEKGFMKEAVRILFPQKEYLTLDKFIQKLSSTAARRPVRFP